MLKPLLGGVLLTGMAIQAQARLPGDEQVWSYYSKAESFSQSATSPLKAALLNGLVGPEPRDGSYIFSRNSIEFGIRGEDYEFSLIHRNDYNLRFLQETSDFAYLNKNNQPIPDGQWYQAGTWANQYQANGFKYGKFYELKPNLTLRTHYSYLNVTESLSGYLGSHPDGSGGQVRFTNQVVNGFNRRILEGNIYSKYHFTYDPFFDREVSSPAGHGLAFDIALDWRINDQWQVELSIDDAIGKIFWNNTAMTEAYATSDLFVQGEDGVWEASPNFEGEETFSNYVQDLTRRDRLKVRYQWQRYHVAYTWQHFSYAQMHRVEAGVAWAEHWGLALSLDPAANSIGMHLDAPIGDFHLMVDNMDSEYTRSFGFGWSMQFGSNK